MNTKPTVKEMARKAAFKAVDNLREDDKLMYFGDGESEAIYSVNGLASQIIEDFFDCHPDQKPTQAIFDDLADQLVL